MCGSTASLENLLKVSRLPICFPGISGISLQSRHFPLLSSWAKVLKTPRGCFIPGVWDRALLKPR